MCQILKNIWVSCKQRSKHWIREDTRWGQSLAREGQGVCRARRRHYFDLIWESRPVSKIPREHGPHWLGDHLCRVHGHPLPRVLLVKPAEPKLLCLPLACQFSVLTSQMGFSSGSVVKNQPAMQKPQEIQFWSLGCEDSLKEEMAIYSSILA